MKHIVSTFRASFDDVEGRVIADEAGTTLTASARVESVSIVDPPEFREHVVRGDDFFDADVHPELTFRSTDIRLGDDGSATVTGDLTIRGISRTITAEGPIGADSGPVRHRAGRAPTACERRPARLGPELAAARSPTAATPSAGRSSSRLQLELVRAGVT